MAPKRYGDRLDVAVDASFDLGAMIDRGRQRLLEARQAGDQRPPAQICAPDNPPITQTSAAKLLNVSRRSVQDARVVQNDGVPELAAAVDSGEIKVSSAAAIARDCLDALFTPDAGLGAVVGYWLALRAALNVMVRWPKD
jgi:hypothetical protein